jgi:MYXO-CTERM domain-containing protein
MSSHIARLRALAVIVSAGVLTPSLAHGYVRYKTECGAPFYWPDKSHLITAYPNDLSAQMTSDQINTAVSGAAAAWSQDAGANACTYNVINIALSTDPTPVAEYDHKNSLIFRSTSWCAPTDVPPKCSYDPQALALTSLFVSKSGSTAGQIKDADVEVNALNFVWTDIAMMPNPNDQDLQNALTHEFGHFIGLDHTCWIAGSLPTDDAGAPIVPLDYMGNPVPECSNTLPASIRDTTMYPSAPPDDTSKRTIEDDDRLGLCSIYPAATGQPSAGSCPDSGPSCNCAVVPTGPGAVVGAGVLALGAVVFARRRRHRRQQRRSGS